jgi:DNA-directed RNA polymerase subunit RPC12/RpoP
MKGLVLIGICLCFIIGCDNNSKEIQEHLNSEKYYVGNKNTPSTNSYCPGSFRCENCNKILYIGIKKGYEWKKIFPQITCPYCGNKICTEDTIEKYKIQ